MSLGKLLAAGRSLMGIKDNGSRYQMRRENLLPKFGSDKNPFGTSPVPDVSAPAPEPKPAARAPRKEPLKAAPVKPEPVKMVTPSLFDPAASAIHPPSSEHNPFAPAVHAPAQPANVTTPAAELLPLNPASAAPQAAAPATTAPVTPARPARTRPRVSLAEWAKKLNPLQYLKLPGAKPVHTRRPVQSELSLERVKVVRNDLSDSDLEIIPARTARPAPAPEETAAQKVEPYLRPPEPVEPAGWGRLGARLFGAEQTTATH